MASTIVLSALEFRTINQYETPSYGGLPFEDDIMEIMPVSIPKAPVLPKKEMIRQIVSSMLMIGVKKSQ